MQRRCDKAEKNAGPAYSCVKRRQCGGTSHEIDPTICLCISVGIEAQGIATAADVDVPTLAARLQAEARARDAIVFAPRLVGVWARHPRG